MNALEAIAVLAIAAIIAGISFYNSSAASDSATQTVTLTEITSTITQIKKAFASSPANNRYGTGTIAAADLIGTGAVPGVVACGSALCNSKGAAMQIVGLSSSFAVDTAGYSKEECAQTIRAIPASTYADGVAVAADLDRLSSATVLTLTISLAVANSSCLATSALRVVAR